MVEYVLEEDLTYMQTLDAGDFVAEGERLIGKTAFEEIMKEKSFREDILSTIRERYLSKRIPPSAHVSLKEKPRDFKRASGNDLFD